MPKVHIKVVGSIADGVKTNLQSKLQKYYHKSQRRLIGWVCKLYWKNIKR